MSIALLKNFSYYTLGQLITQLLSLLLLPLYLIKLSVEEYGIVASLMSVSIFLNALMQYGICPAIMRFYYDFEKKSKEFSGFFTSLLVYTIISNLILICFLFFFSNEVFNYFLPNIDITKYFWYIVLYSLLYYFSLLNLTFFRIESKPRKYLLFNIIQFIISFLLIFYLVAIEEQGAYGKIKGEFYARIPLFIAGIFLFRKYLNFKEIRFYYIKQGLGYSIPLMFQAILWWSLYKLDYFLINIKLGVESVGLYNFAFQLSFLLISLGISFSLAWTPHFYSIARKMKTKLFYGNLIGNFLMILVFFAVIFLIFVSDVLSLLNAKQYFPTLSFIPYLLIGGIFQASYYIIQQLLLYKKKTILIPMILIPGLAFTFTIEYLLIEDYGLIGISIVKAAGFIFIFLATLLAGLKYYYFKLNMKKIFIAICLLIINFLIISAINIRDFKLIFKLLLMLLNVLVIFKLKFFTQNEISFVRNIFK